ncbi:MAG: RND family transporter, partial [Flavobacterium sp.]|nr:RND family transporter [Flavobacterium sp.]
MENTKNNGFWEYLSGLILKNRLVILSLILVITIFLGLQWRNLSMTYQEANLLPKDHVANIEYNQFLGKFGEEGNLIVIGFQDNRFFTPKAFLAWKELMSGLKSCKEIDLVVSISDLKKLEKDTINEKFQLVPFFDNNKVQNPEYLQQIKQDLFNNLPFYEGLLFNKKT